MMKEFSNDKLNTRTHKTRPASKRVPFRNSLNSQGPCHKRSVTFSGHSNPVTGNIDDKTILEAFDDLVEDMKTNSVTNGPAEAGMTFFGQFVDHDITLDATSAIGTEIDPQSIRNIRTPSLDLDCVYGDGPEASPHLYSRITKVFSFSAEKTTTSIWHVTVRVRR